MTEQQGSQGLIKSISNFLKSASRMSWWETIRSVFVLFFVSLAIVFITKPESLIAPIADYIERHAQRKEQQAKDEHMDLFYRRMEADNHIRGYLTGLLEASGADRTFVFEPHNGSSNLSSGLPFIYMDLTLDVPGTNITPLPEGEYKDMRLSNYPFATELFTDGYWFGSLEDLKAIDTKLYHKMAANNVNEMAVMIMWDGREPLGLIGLTWCGNNKMDPEKVGRLIRECATKVAVELLIVKRYV